MTTVLHGTWLPKIQRLFVWAEDARAVGRRRRTVIRLDRMVRRDKAKLTPDRVAYFCHPDWVVSPDRAPPPALWQPLVPTREGLEETARWYREQGWL